jgi:hypothetical protein
MRGEVPVDNGRRLAHASDARGAGRSVSAATARSATGPAPIEHQQDEQGGTDHSGQDQPPPVRSRHGTFTFTFRCH